MAKKFRRTRTLIRTAPKSQEKYLIENAKQLYEDPYLILPDCTDVFGEKIFTKMQKRLDKIHRFRDDTEKLEKLSKKKGLEGALAGTLLLAKSEKAPYLAVAPFPSGKIVYAQRGRASKEKLIGLQHVDNPVLRLFGIQDIIAKKHLYVYSWDSGYVCTGRQATPPPEFVSFVLNQLGLDHRENIYSCKHLPCDIVKECGCSEKFYLRIFWKSANHMIALCEECARSSGNTMFTLSKNMLLPKLSNDFFISVVTQMIPETQDPTAQNALFLSEYFSGSITDSEMIKKNIQQHRDSIQHLSKQVLILNGVSYGSDVDRFIEALHPNQYERVGLDFILHKVEEPVILQDGSSHTVLERYWSRYGKEVLCSILNDTTLAESFSSLEDTPNNIIRLATEYSGRQQILSQLPQYSSLPPLASFVDHIAKTYKTYGEKKTLQELRKHPDSTKGKSITYAFLLVLGKADETKWKYSSVELEYGEFLREYAQKIFDAAPSQYHAALQDFITASGSSETLSSPLT